MKSEVTIVLPSRQEKRKKKIEKKRELVYLFVPAKTSLCDPEMCTDLLRRAGMGPALALGNAAVLNVQQNLVFVNSSPVLSCGFHVPQCCTAVLKNPAVTNSLAVPLATLHPHTPLCHGSVLLITCFKECTSIISQHKDGPNRQISIRMSIEFKELTFMRAMNIIPCPFRYN